MSIEYKVVNGAAARKIDIQNLPWPNDATVIYAIDTNSNEIIGRLALMNVLHIEGAWIKEDRRNSIVLPRLFEEIESILKQDERTSALSFVNENDKKLIEQMPKRNYVKLPYNVFLKNLKG